jgi:hypothetical protein
MLNERIKMKIVPMFSTYNADEAVIRLKFKLPLEEVDGSKESVVNVNVRPKNLELIRALNAYVFKMPQLDKVFSGFDKFSRESQALVTERLIKFRDACAKAGGNPNALWVSLADKLRYEELPIMPDVLVPDPAEQELLRNNVTGELEEEEAAEPVDYWRINVDALAIEGLVEDFDASSVEF